MIRTDYPPEESVIKPIGEIAQLIEALPMKNFLCLMVNLSKLYPPEPPQESIIIGVND